MKTPDISSEFDPFRVVVSFASEADSADLFIESFTGIGLTFDVNLVSADSCSRGKRIRALRPRVLEAYGGLSTEAKLAAANRCQFSLLTLVSGGFVFSGSGPVNASPRLWR